MITNNTIKEYYIKLQSLYYDVLNMVNAINQSLTTTASEVTVTLTDNNNEKRILRIPSFLYLENKIEKLSLNMENLINIPNSGNAWLENDKGLHKIQLVKAKTAPPAPEFKQEDYYISFKDNNILRDMVSPKTFLRINIDNLTDNIEKMFMKKFIIFDETIFKNSLIQEAKDYNEFKAAINNYEKGTIYEEYESVLDMPLKEDEYDSNFRILEVPETEDEDNLWIDNSNGNNIHYTYKVVVDTIEYKNAEDSSIVFQLKVGDYICLKNDYNIYKIKNIVKQKNTLYIEEVIGHITLQDYESNSEMEFKLYNFNYNKYHYIDIPLEENQYICVFLGTVYNNVRSTFSKPILIDLSTIYMKNQNGDFILDEYGEKISYIDYYNKFCSNIGDLILGITQASYPQLSNYNARELSDLQESDTIKDLVSRTLNAENILKVIPINKHLIDDVITEDIINLHSQKSEINSNLSAIEDNISQVYNQLVTTDFSQDVTTSQMSLKSKLTEYYTERVLLQKQLISIIDIMNSKSKEKTLTNSKTKYRVRGVSDIKELTDYLKNTFDNKCELIGLDVEYKYKSNITDTTTLSNINSNTFTDWNKLNNVERERYLTFNIQKSAFGIDYVSYENTNNIIKWNQIDIPIKQGEDVILRYRYKYSIGQPYINIYTPWSDELKVVFPSEYSDNVEITSILGQNEEDTITAKFSKTLINEGYQEHINNKLISGDQNFYHMPENIYSGFNTPENTLISLKDKLLSMVKDIEKYKDLIDHEINYKLGVYLTYDDKTIELNNHTTNKVNIYNTDHINSNFVRKEMNLVFKNISSTRVNLYSLFPGKIDEILLKKKYDYNREITNYERVPLMVGDKIHAQTEGQWIYFRQNSIFSGKDYYLNLNSQRMADVEIMGLTNVNTSPYFKSNFYDYISKDNSQVLLVYRKRLGDVMYSYRSYWQGLSKSKNGEVQFINYNEDLNEKQDESMILNYDEMEDDFFIYQDYKDHNNRYIMRYEDFYGIVPDESNEKQVFLDTNTSINYFLSKYSTGISTDGDSSILTGAFLFPNLESMSQILTSGEEREPKVLEVGDSVSVPIVFEYYLESNQIKSIKKTLSFDLKTSLIKEPVNYVLEVSINSDMSASGNIYNTSLVDTIITDTDNNILI